MFALGVEVSFGELQRVRRAALLGGAIQIPLTIVLGTAAGLAAGWPLRTALLLGGAFAISSSLVALKLLLGRGEVESPQGRVALGLGVVQDLSLIPMLALLPVLSGDAIDPAVILRALATSAVALIAVIIVGTRVVPRLLYWAPAWPVTLPDCPSRSGPSWPGWSSRSPSSTVRFWPRSYPCGTSLPPSSLWRSACWSIPRSC
jgi:CPA2 family monovalent cation:H+ antiporter-2